MKDSFAKRLKHAMSEKGFNSAKLADKTGISKSLISAYLNEKYVPKNDKITKIADVLDVNPLYLTGDDTNINFNENFLNLYSLVKTNDEDAIVNIVKKLSKLDENELKIVLSLINQLYDNKKQ